jgi:hypothetical protein
VAQKVGCLLKERHVCASGLHEGAANEMRVMGIGDMGFDARYYQEFLVFVKRFSPFFNTQSNGFDGTRDCWRETTVMNECNLAGL